MAMNYYGPKGLYGNYQPYYQQPLPEQLTPYQQQQAATLQTDERIWVQNQTAAESYLVAPNSFVRLWDSSKNVFYEKRADPTGRPFMDAFKYERITGNPATEEQKDVYGPKISDLEKRIIALEKGVIKNDDEQ